MSSGDPEADVVRREHASMLEEIDRLERDLFTGAPRSAREVRGRLSALLQQMRAHMESEERGVFRRVIRRAPALAAEIHRLEAEHPQLQESLAALVELAPDSGVDPPGSRFCRAALEWICALKEHESREMAVIQEAWLRDLGDAE